jgi:ribulose-bisphosphate carboxylase large chain
MTNSAPIRARYLVRSTSDQIERLARFVAFEQTVELPEALVPASLLDDVVGKVSAIAATSQIDQFEVVIEYKAALASAQLSQLLNLLYGNVSMLSGVRCVGVELPPSVLRSFHGPLHGIDGIRKLTGVYGRPLLATAIKPRGLSNEALAKIAGDFALGGGDIVKDDQNLVSEDFEAFKSRVDLCAKAVARANDRTGKQCLYFPHLSAASEELDKHAEFVYRLGLQGVLVCPMLLGLDRSREITARFGLVQMAHPALTGAFTDGSKHGLSHDLLLGTLFRLAGADISVFPAPGGRFDYRPEHVQAVAQRLGEPLGNLQPAWACPAGGMTFANIPELGQTYGENCVLLMGGSLLGHGPDLVQSTAAFVARIGQGFAEKREKPQPELISSCEFNPSEDGEAVRSLLKFLPNFHWEGRTDRVYKMSSELNFSGVRRVELIGKAGEQADFDLRYFEIQTGGFTSLEKHLHTHVIIVVRGQGTLIVDEQSESLVPMDVAYVRPLQVHQLRNDGEQPFGFFCVVDRERDRPMRP